MKTPVHVDDRFHNADTSYAIPTEGEHTATIADASTPKEDQVAITFRIAEGSSKNMTVEQNYNLDLDMGLFKFRQLTDTLGIVAAGNRIDIGEAVGRSVLITIKHKSKDDRTFANVYAVKAQA